MFANQIDEKFWLDPPWQRYPQKYNLGLRPIKLKDWLASNPSDEILNHKKKLLSTNYERVVSTVNHPDNPEFILSKHFQTNSIYPDLIANISLEVEDDLCIIESQGDQKLLAACVCSPSYWKLSEKIGKPLLSIHKPVKTLNSKIKVIGSGRTDAGVNAWGQSANFYHKEEIKNFFKFLSTANFFLSKYSVSILSLKKKNLTFHARHSAKKREYEYVILNRTAKPSVDDNRVWLVKKKLNLDEMKKAAKYFIGKHNFSAFRSSSCTAKSPIRTINNLKITKRGDKIIIKILSKSFLQKQVRSMVGCLKFVGENKWNALKIKKVILSKQRKNCAPPAPAQGLFLKKIYY